MPPTSSEWLVLQQGASRGPFTTAYVQVLLHTRQITPATPIAPKGSDQWEAAQRRPQFAPPPRTPKRQPAPAREFTLWSADRPNMVNAIGIYGLVATPLFTVFTYGTCCVEAAERSSCTARNCLGSKCWFACLASSATLS